MLTRRTFLTTIAAAPLTKFCKTEPVRPKRIVVWHRGFETVRLNRPILVHGTGEWRIVKITEDKAEVERRYALPQGTLG